MGLYILLHKNYWRRENLIFGLYKLLLERLEADFNFKPISKFNLYQGFRDNGKGPLYINSNFGSQKFLAKIDQKIRPTPSGKKARFTVRVKGAIQIKNFDNIKLTCSYFLIPQCFCIKPRIHCSYL
ncbi:hypothetical protein LCGC14_2998490 [marine sediment metagenome]|uniref:Uncharacterized protein n=1 Tax=marine sediment metagenome TaxID=412755 RepID=A0A0F8X1R5_9ZZZZ